MQQGENPVLKSVNFCLPNGKSERNIAASKGLLVSITQSGGLACCNCICIVKGDSFFLRGVEILSQ